MSANPISKIFVVLAVLAAALLTISSVSRSAPSKADLSRAPRPVILVYPGTAHLSDFYERHKTWTAQATSVSIPVTGANEPSDFYQRFEARTMAGAAVETSDYFMRHPELSALAVTSVDTSDYFLRHPELSTSAISIDLSDYFLRHPELRNR